jgi:hypothetical protein
MHAVGARLIRRRSADKRVASPSRPRSLRGSATIGWTKLADMGTLPCDGLAQRWTRGGQKFGAAVVARAGNTE